MMIERYISSYLPSSTAPLKQGVYFDTAAQLALCAETNPWHDQEYQALAFLSKRVEISRGLYDSYLENGARASSERLSSPWATLALVLLFKDFMRLSVGADNSNAVKRLNAVLKLADFLSSEKVVLEAEFLEFIHITAEAYLRGLAPAEAMATESLVTPMPGLADPVLPITVLFWEGAIARAYLATLKSMGLRAGKIIHLVSKKNLATKKPVGRFLPGFMRLVYAQSHQKNSIHHWSGVLQKTETSLFQRIKGSVERDLGFSPSTIDDALALADLNVYSSDVEALMIDDLADEGLYRRLSELPSTRILFTGGGILPKRLLEIQSLKFIHIHPGYLPDVRGADCALWSHLMKGRTSATCFYMAPGIDDGDIIFAAYLPSLNVGTEGAGTPVKSLYRATYAFLDPWIRASVLRKAVALTQGFTCVEAFPQEESASVTYHFMHEKIQQVAFSRLFAGNYQ
ncbi:MAG: formyltransferase family protein [Pseudomonas chlororaphis]